MFLISILFCFEVELKKNLSIVVYSKICLSGEQEFNASQCDNKHDINNSISR